MHVVVVKSHLIMDIIKSEMYTVNGVLKNVRKKLKQIVTVRLNFQARTVKQLK